MFETYAGLPRSIYVLFVARIINRFGSFIYPLLTFLMTGKLGFSNAEAGSIMLMMGLMSMAGNMLGGFLADHMGRKKVYVIAQGLAAALLFACGFFGTSKIIIGLILLSDFFGAMVRPVSSAMVTDLTPREDRKKAFSLLYLGINFGVALGSAVSGFLYESQMRWLFFGDGLTTFISLIFIISMVPETQPSKEDIAQSMAVNNEEKAEKGWALKVLLERPVLLIFMMLGFINNIIYSQHSFAIPIHLNGLVGDDFGAKYFGVLMSFNAIVVLIFTTVLTALTRKIKAIHIMGIASFLYAVGFGMLSSINQIPLFYLSTLFWTWGEILAVTNQGVFISNHSPINFRGRFNSLTGFLMGLGFTVGPWLSGHYIEITSIHRLWLTIGLLAIMNLFGYGLLARFEGTEQQKEQRAKVGA